MTKTREEMINFIAEEYVDNIDIREYLKDQFHKISNELENMPDDYIKAEYESMQPQ